MRLALFGPPGAGKGTQAAFLAQQFGICAISTGKLIRTAIAEQSRQGKEAEAYVHAGRLVPGRVVRDLANRAIADCGFDGFALDGYPRTVEQADWLTEFLTAYKAPLQSVISLELSDDAIVYRLSRRRVDRVTGATYHLDYNPPPEDLDPESLIRRRDDDPEIIRARLISYREETLPVKAYFQERGLLEEIDGSESIIKIKESIFAHVAPYSSPALV